MTGRWLSGVGMTLRWLGALGMKPVVACVINRLLYGDHHLAAYHARYIVKRG
jgi:hypothetical protein